MGINRPSLKLYAQRALIVIGLFAVTIVSHLIYQAFTPY